MSEHKPGCEHASGCVQMPQGWWECASDCCVGDDEQHAAMSFEEEKRHCEVVADECNEYFWDGEDGGVTKTEWLAYLAGRFARERSSARREALEEAALAVEGDLTSGLLTPGNVKQSARAIRSLKEKP